MRRFALLLLALVPLGLASRASADEDFALRHGPRYRPYEPAYDPDPVPVHVELSAQGAATSDGTLAGVGVTVDSRFAGMNLEVDALTKDGVTGDPNGSHDAIALGNLHLTWTVLHVPGARVRLEAGGSMVSLPSTGYFRGTPYAGKVLIGPDLGVSADFGFPGPIGVVAHVRATPVPVPILDTGVALALRTGPFGLTLGWRGLHLAGDWTDAPKVDFSGPEVGLRLRF